MCEIEFSMKILFKIIFGNYFYISASQNSLTLKYIVKVMILSNICYTEADNDYLYKSNKRMKVDRMQLYIIYFDAYKIHLENICTNICFLTQQNRTYFKCFYQKYQRLLKNKFKTLNLRQ